MNFKKNFLYLIIGCLGLFEIGVVFIILFDNSIFNNFSSGRIDFIDYILLITAILISLFILISVIYIIMQKPKK